MTKNDNGSPHVPARCQTKLNALMASLAPELREEIYRVIDEIAGTAYSAGRASERHSEHT